MKYPLIDPSVKYIGVSKLRAFTAGVLREMTDTFVIQENDTPLAVLLRYDTFLSMQAELKEEAAVSADQSVTA